MQEQRMRRERISVVCFCPQETLRVLIFLLFMCMHILSLLNDQWFYFFVCFFRQQSFIGLSLRIASLPFHLFFLGGGGMVRLHVGYVGLCSSDCLFVDLLFPRSNQLLYYCSSCLTLDVACDVIFIGQFKLITEMFHITHRALHIGLTTTIQHYNRIMRLDILSTHSYILKTQSVAILFLKSNWTLCEVAKAIAPISMMNKQMGLLWVNPVTSRSDQHETSPNHVLIIQQTGNENI